MAGSAQSARSGHRRKLHKRPASNHLRGDADQAREGPWRVGASLLKSDLALAGHAKCNGRECKMQLFTSGDLHPLVLGFINALTYRRQGRSPYVTPKEFLTARTAVGLVKTRPLFASSMFSAGYGFGPELGRECPAPGCNRWPDPEVPPFDCPLCATALPRSATSHLPCWCLVATLLLRGTPRSSSEQQGSNKACTSQQVDTTRPPVREECRGAARAADCV